MSYENTIEAVNPANNPGCSRLQEEYLNINTALRNITASNTTDSISASNSSVPPLELVAGNRVAPIVGLSNLISNPDVSNSPPPQVDANNRLPDVSHLNSARTAKSELNNPFVTSRALESNGNVDCSAAPGDQRPSPEMMRKGREQLSEGLEKGKWPEGEEGRFLLADSLESYLDHGKDFLKEFAKESNEAFQQSPLKDKVKVGVSEASRKDRADLQKKAEQLGLKLEHTGVLELKDKDGKVTDRRVIGVLTGPQGQKVAIQKP